MFLSFKDDSAHWFQVYNKNEAAVLHGVKNPWVKSIEHRKNVILMGDSLGDSSFQFWFSSFVGDVDMSEGIKHPNLVLVWFSLSNYL